MGNFIVFSDYDIIAYLMVGLAMFMALDLVFGFGFLYRTNWNTGSVTGILLLAYLSGHLISIPGKWVFEDWAVHSCLKQPLVHLLPASAAPDKSEPSWISSVICKTTISWVPWTDYDTEATQDVQKLITAKQKMLDDKSLFHQAFITAKRDANTYERMLIFQRLYLLFRNMAFLALSALVAVLIKRIMIGLGYWQNDQHLIHYGVKAWMLSFWTQLPVFLVLTVGLLDRFLFFYRLYSLEVLSAYAYSYGPSPIAE